MTFSGVFEYAFTSEGLFGGLDFAPVVLALAIWAVFPLYKLLPLDASSESAQGALHSPHMSDRTTSGEETLHEGGGGHASAKRGPVMRENKPAAMV